MSELVIAEKSDLVSIADEIRAIVGDTNEMPLDKIKSNLSKTKGDIDSCFSALVKKGVTVPANTLLSDMRALIDEIEVDNGMLLGHEFKCGTVTPAEDITDEYVIKFDATFKTHSEVSSTPYHFFLYRQTLTGVPNNSWVWLVMGRKAKNSSYGFGQYTSNTGSLSNASYLAIIGEASYNNKVSISCEASRKLVAGETYIWIAISSF